MRKPDTKTQKPQPVVTLSIKPGQISPKMRHDSVTFWRRLISDTKREVDSER